jgi:uncharacterized repeat protein (TIGR01451 family)
MGVLLLVLALGSAAPANAFFTVDATNSSAASPYIIDGSNSPFADEISVNGGWLKVVDGGSITSTASGTSGVIVQSAGGGSVTIEGGSVSGAVDGVILFGGTLTMTGGSVSGPNAALQVNPGRTATISGGSLSSDFAGVVQAGTLTISGTASVSGASCGVYDVGGAGTISGGSVTSAVLWDNSTLSISGGSLTGGVLLNRATSRLDVSGGSVTGGLQNNQGGTATVSGCSLAVTNGVLTGTLTDGTPINTPVSGPITLAGPTPVITLIGSSTMSVECHTSFTDPGATALDACGSITVIPSGSVDVTNPSSYTITYTATDGANAATPVTRTVHVVDTTPPVITLNGASSMTVECHGTFSDPGAAANDICAGSLPVTPSGTVDVNTPGSYTLTYTATDPSGNSAAATRTVHVVDTTRPVITPPANITQATDPGQCSALVNPGTPTATDTCAGVLTPVGARSDGQALTAPYPPGTTTITWTASDPSGNQATVSQTVLVLDHQPPTITCPGNMTVKATLANGAAVSYPAPTASDNCGAATVVSTPPSGSIFPVGTTTVTCTVADSRGNTATCNFTVTVVAIADVSLTMSASPSPVVTGNNLTYTLVVRNAGPQPAQGVVLTDPLPGGVGFASAASSLAGSTLTTPKAGTAGTVTWNVGTLNSGQSATLTVVVKVNAKAGATINNIASVSSSSPPDPDPSNNGATVSTAVVAKH